MSITIVFGLPGNGKSYLSTTRVCKELVAGKKHVVTNYPVQFKGKTPIKWNSRFAIHGLNNSLIVIDEGYREFNSREYKGFSPEEHLFFATNRHNDNDIIIIAQHPARIEKVIREISSFVMVKKISLFRPLLFRTYHFDIEEDLSLPLNSARVGASITWFRKKYAKSYDTHYYKTDSLDMDLLERWPTFTRKVSIFKRLLRFFSIHKKYGPAF